VEPVQILHALRKASGRATQQFSVVGLLGWRFLFAQVATGQSDEDILQAGVASGEPGQIAALAL